MRTIDLIAKAESRGTLTDAARALGLEPNTLSAAKATGRLSPALAAALADHLGEPVARWTVTALLEGQRSAPMSRALRRAMNRLPYQSTPRLTRRLAGTTKPTRTRAPRTVVRCEPSARAIAG